MIDKSLVKNGMNEQQVRETLKQMYPCFVLIACGEPTRGGQLEVEMVYEGDPSLAAYLIESAQALVLG